MTEIEQLKEEIAKLKEQIRDITGEGCHAPGSTSPAPGGTQGHIHPNFDDHARFIYFLNDRISALAHRLGVEIEGPEIREFRKARMKRWGYTDEQIAAAV